MCMEEGCISEMLEVQAAQGSGTGDHRLKLANTVSIL